MLSFFNAPLLSRHVVLSSSTDGPARFRVRHIASSFFFFSSRRRHTRLVSDWSSDVCSSDLPSPRRSPSTVIAGTSPAWTRGSSPGWARRNSPSGSVTPRSSARASRECGATGPLRFAVSSHLPPATCCLLPATRIPNDPPRPVLRGLRPQPRSSRRVLSRYAWPPGQQAGLLRPGAFSRAAAPRRPPRGPRRRQGTGGPSHRHHLPRPRSPALLRRAARARSALRERAHSHGVGRHGDDLRSGEQHLRALGRHPARRGRGGGVMDRAGPVLYYDGECGDVVLRI